MAKKDKRANGLQDEGDPSTKKSKAITKLQEFSSYSGYVPSVDNEQISEISISDIDAETFWKQYVEPRRPALINGVISGFNIDALKSRSILQTLEKDNGEHFVVQIEHAVQGGYGSGKKRLEMKFDDFIEKAKQGDLTAYLTTQYSNDEDDDDEDEEENGFSGDEPLSADKEDSIDGEEDDEENESETDKNNLDSSFKQDLETASDADSIDFNDLHDDFDDLNPDEDIDDFSEKPLATIDSIPLYEVEAKERLFELVQRPLTSLVAKNQLPIRPAVLQNLIPQQINVWIGAKNDADQKKPRGFALNIDEKKPDFGLGRSVPGSGTSSGLHHDHADNLYIPVQGKKRFTIFPPSEAFNLYTVGDVNKVYNSGVIDYKVNEKAPTWRHLRSDGTAAEEPEERRATQKGSKQEKSDPPSFCRVPPVLLHDDELPEEEQQKLAALKEKRFPKLLKAKRITAQIEAGQMLYLPTGWFHEVTSFAGGSEGAKNSPEGKDGSGNMHIAVNYWFYPVDGDSFQRPYLNLDWDREFERTQKSIDLHQEGAFDLADEF